MGENFKVTSTVRKLGRGRLSPRPFAKGGMRFAYYLETDSGVYAVKAYNKECLAHITEGLGISEAQAIRKEVNTYLVAAELANSWNQALPGALRHRSNMMKFLAPCVFTLRDKTGQIRTMFGEEYVAGNFIKWNNNAGYVNTDDEAKVMDMGEMAGTFCHYAWHSSKGRLMAVDIQGWNLGGASLGDRDITFTDPQVHTHSFTGGRSRKTDPLFQRFSLGNLGRTGMVRFFQAHECSRSCRLMGLPPVDLSRDFGNAPAPRAPHRNRGSVLAEAPQVPGPGRPVGRDQAMGPPQQLEDKSKPINRNKSILAMIASLLCCEE